ncbi:MAG: 5'/3'-nucleotidase SurE [Myxococcales bacterium]|nr:5'/3'-nucleotidase SurE [Myxococcales bacterium]
MNILLTNDDGFDAPGLRALEHALEGLGTLWTVAPLSEQSAKSHALSMRDPIRALERGPRAFAVTGTPADCVYLAVNQLLPGPPDLVVSGINAGSNLATDVFYSGTVAGAREASCFGVRALAASLWISGGAEPHWAVAGRWVRQVAERMLSQPPTPGVLLNLNVPGVEHPRGLKLATLGRRHYLPTVAARQDLRGKPYYWIGGDHERFEGPPNSDGHLCEAGWVTLTPLQLDHTAHDVLAGLGRDWGGLTSEEGNI